MYFNSDVITRHYHLHVLRKEDLTGNVCGSEVELRTVFVKEWCVTTTLFFRQNVNLSFEFSVRLNRTWLTDYHTSTDLIFINTSQQQTYVITSLTSVKDLTEHFHTGYGRLQAFSTHTQDIYRISGVDNTCFDTTCSYSTSTCDREYVFYWHKERLIGSSCRKWNPVIYCIHQLFDLSHPLRLAVKTTQSRTLNYRNIIAIEFVE